jgi:RimJ/RimL family protein N-acetyltransferase
MEITLEASTDFAVINGVLAHEDIYSGASDDFAPVRADVDARGAGMVFVLIRCDGELAGLFALQFHSTVMAEIHTCIFAKFRGSPATRAAAAIIYWVFSQTSCLKLITLVPAFNRAALFYARRAGLRQEGVITKSFLKGGVLHDQILLGLCKEQPSCQF